MSFAQPALSDAAQSFLSSHAKANLLIGGSWTGAKSGDVFPTLDPATGETLAEVAMAGTADVDAAVAAARKALPGWRATPPV